MSGRTDRPADQADVDQLEEQGFIVRRRVVSNGEADHLAAGIMALASQELGRESYRPIPGNGYYVRRLHWKDERFHPYVRWPETILLARAMLGPRVRVALDARIADREPGSGVDWHIHTPPPELRAPWATTAQTMACLLYLDDVRTTEGSLALVPGSHREHWTTDDAAAAEVAERAVHLTPQKGDLVVTHGNLWHRTVPSTAGSAPRRVLFVGYGPAWMILDARVAGQPDRVERRVASITWPDGAAPDPDEQDDLLGRFRW